MKVLSLFDGVSCARLALERAGIQIDAYYASEIDKYAIKVTQANRPDTVQLGSVTEVTGIHGIDLLIGGSPCQDLSIASANRKGLEGERSGLFWEYVRLLKEVQPKYFILENVASMPKEAKAIITEALGVEPIMINAALVSAQNRKRLFWTNIPDVAQPEDKDIYLKDILESGESDRLKSYCIDACYYKGANWEQYKKNGRRQLVIDKHGNEKLKSNTVRSSGRSSGVDDKHNWDTIRIGDIGSNAQAQRVYSPDGKSVALSALGGGQGAKTGLYMINPKMQNYKHNYDKSVTLASSMYKEPPVILDTESPIIRKLTPTECERLQSMPDNWTNPTGDISNSQRYKMCGNAFNVDVVAHILKNI